METGKWEQKAEVSTCCRN